MESLYRRHRFPPEIISHAVWLYHRFTLSFRDVEDLLAERGITVSYEAIRSWCRKFGPAYARTLRRRQGRLGDIWHELFDGEAVRLARANVQSSDVDVAVLVLDGGEVGLQVGTPLLGGFLAVYIFDCSRPSTNTCLPLVRYGPRFSKSPPTDNPHIFNAFLS